jgi:hypothetical protein
MRHARWRSGGALEMQPVQTLDQVKLLALLCRVHVRIRQMLDHLPRLARLQ